MAESTRHERRYGYLTGSVTIDDGSARQDLRGHVWVGPTGDSGTRISAVSHGAKFILLAEKQTILQRLIKTQFHQIHSCVLATGTGYPGRSFHAVLRQLYEQLRIPLYVLSDNDPAGIMFYFLIARGSVRRHSRPDVTVAIPDAVHLGLRVADYERLGLTESAQISLSDPERETLAHLKSCSWLRSSEAWQQEIEVVLRRGFKVEVEALSLLGGTYLADTYLPERIAAKR